MGKPADKHVESKKDVITTSEVSIISAHDGYVLVTDFRFEFANGKEESFDAIIQRFDSEVMAFRNNGLNKLAKSFGIPIRFEDSN